MSVEIKIKLKVKDVEIELSKDEAVKLKEALDELTGKVKIEKEYIPYPYWPSYPWRWWTWGTAYVGNMTYTAQSRISSDIQLLAAVS